MDRIDEIKERLARRQAVKLEPGDWRFVIDYRHFNQSTIRAIGEFNNHAPGDIEFLLLKLDLIKRHTRDAVAALKEGELSAFTAIRIALAELREVEAALNDESTSPMPGEPAQFVLGGKTGPYSVPRKPFNPDIEALKAKAYGEYVADMLAADPDWKDPHEEENETQS